MKYLEGKKGESPFRRQQTTHCKEKATKQVRNQIGQFTNQCSGSFWSFQGSFPPFKEMTSFSLMVTTSTMLACEHENTSLEVLSIHISRYPTTIEVFMVYTLII